MVFWHTFILLMNLGEPTQAGHREQLLEKFQPKMNRFGLVAMPTSPEAEELTENYHEALKRFLEVLNPSVLLRILSVRTRINEIGGSFKSGQMRLGVYPLDINFPTAMFFNTGDCMATDRSQVSDEDLQTGMFKALTGSGKRDYPSDIDLRLQRKLLFKKWNPMRPDRALEIDVYEAMKQTYHQHGVFINIFPDTEKS